MASTFKIKFGTNLKLLRKKRGISQEKLSELIGISQRNLSKIETGQTFPSTENLEKISKVFNCSPSILFEFDSVYDVKFIREDIINYIQNLGDEDLIKVNKILDIFRFK